ncbi:MAG: hypothetical protein R3E12_16090 [Candidatus Eisenbacteria bacterium]
MESTVVRTSRFDVIMVTLYLASLAAVALLFVDGLPYYLTPFVDRPHHPGYAALRPAGSRGLVFGVVGTAMMLALLLYSVRKRSRKLVATGPVRKWLNFHIYLGIMGPLLITLHTSFRVTGLVALSYWSMVAVALSGAFGRYLYQQIPRNVLGHALGPSELRDREHLVDRDLRENHGITDESLRHLERMAGDTGSKRSMMNAIFFTIGSEFAIRRQLNRLMVSLEPETPQRLELSRKLAEKVALHRRLLLLDQLNLAFHYWHVIHKPFAIVMYTILAVHVGISLFLGYVKGF